MAFISISDYNQPLKQSDGNSFEVKSSSKNTAELSPMILTQSDTDVTRTMFIPKMVDNSKSPNMCISGKISYEKRQKNDEYPSDKLSPHNIRVGESMEINLNTEAIYKLFSYLSDLYGFHESNGIPQGRRTFSQVDGRLSDLLEFLQNDPEANEFLTNPQSLDLTKMLFQRITQFQSIDALLGILNSLTDDNISILNNSINLERLNRAISLIEDNLDNSNEEFWQTEVFASNQWILSQIFATPCTILGDKAYVGGKGIDNKRGNIVDFIYLNKLSENVALIEIKTPKTNIIHSKYRQSYSFTEDMSGSINQVINYRNNLIKNYNSIRDNSIEEFKVFSPKCIVIIGKIKDMNSNEIGAFESFRNSLNNIEIIAFDEILQRIKDLRSIFV